MPESSSREKKKKQKLCLIALALTATVTVIASIAGCVVLVENSKSKATGQDQKFDTRPKRLQLKKDDQKSKKGKKPSSDLRIVFKKPAKKKTAPKTEGWTELIKLGSTVSTGLPTNSTTIKSSQIVSSSNAKSTQKGFCLSTLVLIAA